MRVEEAVLTGESVPVEKFVRSGRRRDIPRRPVLHGLQQHARRGWYGSRRGRGNRREHRDRQDKPHALPGGDAQHASDRSKWMCSPAGSRS